jgi:hypothetical protein
MNRKLKFRSVAEAVGLLGAMGSLIFVGLEVRQNTEATRLDAAQQLTQTWFQWDLEMGAGREGWEALEVVLQFEDPGTAPFVERSMVLSLARTQFQAWATWHHLWESGVLDNALWRATEREIRMDINSETGRITLWAWGEAGPQFREGFRAFLDGIVASRAGG